MGGILYLQARPSEATLAVGIAKGKLDIELTQALGVVPQRLGPFDRTAFTAHVSVQKSIKGMADTIFIDTINEQLTKLHQRSKFDH